MGNPRATTKKTPVSRISDARAEAAPKVYKFEDFQREANRKRAGQPKPPPIPPFVINVGEESPPIVITEPDTLERQLVVADFIGVWQAGNWNMDNSLPLLRALCGNQFGRVWMLIKDDPDPAVMMELLRAMFDHFNGVLAAIQEAEELPGGTGDSSN